MTNKYMGKHVTCIHVCPNLNLLQQKLWPSEVYTHTHTQKTVCNSIGSHFAIPHQPKRKTVGFGVSSMSTCLCIHIRTTSCMFVYEHTEF